MDRYYYLLSELPYLKFNQKPGINKDAFLQEVAKWLSDKDLELLVSADINPFSPEFLSCLQQGSNNRRESEKVSFRNFNNFNDYNNRMAVINEYQCFEEKLRDELAGYRRDSRDGLNKTGQILNPSLIEGNPLEIERKLLFLRWKFIEEQETGNNFNLEMVVLYFLKLQILERLYTFNKQKGENAFKSLCNVRLWKNLG